MSVVVPLVSGLAAPPVGSEPRRVLRRCRHALIMCWKFLLSQLNDENARRHLSSEHKELYFDLITLIAESAEFDLTNSPRSDDNAKQPSVDNNAHVHSFSWRSPRADFGWDTGKNVSPRASLTSSALVALAVTGPPSVMSDSGRQPRSVSGSSPNAKPNDLGYPLSFSSNMPLGFVETAADGPDERRAIFQYRCLLVATFKMVVENMDAARHRRRAWVPLAEMRFFAKALAICYVRVQAVQELLQDDIYAAYARKRWANRGAHDSKLQADVVDPPVRSRPAQPEKSLKHKQSRRRPHRVLTSAQLWSGVTFAGTLGRWGEFHGCVLDETDSPDLALKSASSSSNSTGSGYCSSSTGNSHAFKETKSQGSASTPTEPRSSAPTRHQVEAFKLRNPTLFRWTQFAPYLGSYSDADVFSLSRSLRSSLRRKLTRDGEFFATFMGFLSWHIEATASTVTRDRSFDSTVVWDAIPGYSLLARVSMLLVKEACWAKWLYVRDKSGPLPPTSMELQSPSSSTGSTDEDEDDGGNSDAPFALQSIRAIRTVLDNVVQLLRNKEMLDSCVMAMYESTNVLHARSVDVCLVRFEEWLMATSSTPTPLIATGSCDANMSSASPRSNGQLRVPETLNSKAFGVGVRVMLASDNCEILNRTLLFLYSRIDLLDGELRQSVLKALVQRHMALFLHWNPGVRRNYHHLLVYKLARAPRDLLVSPIDHLLLGKLATAAFVGQEDLSSLPARHRADSGTGLDCADDRYNTWSGASSPPSSGFKLSGYPSRIGGGSAMSAADFSRLRLEQALWRAFDACTAVICVNERRIAREAHRRYQHELLAAQCRAAALCDLNRSSMDNSYDGDGGLVSTPLSATLSTVNESLPGESAAAREVERLDDELHREPPYYLRYLPSEELAVLDDLRRLASAVRYPAGHQIYAAPSLREFSDLLKTYYRELHAQAAPRSARSAPGGFVTVPPPPLGYY